MPLGVCLPYLILTILTKVFFRLWKQLYEDSIIISIRDIEYNYHIKLLCNNIFYDVMDNDDIIEFIQMTISVNSSCLNNETFYNRVFYVLHLYCFATQIKFVIVARGRGFLQTQNFLANFDKVALWWGTGIIAEENSKFIDENVYYDGKLNLKLSIYFTKCREVYPEFDRYLWTELKEEIILIYYLHFFTFTGNWYKGMQLL